MIRGLKLDLLTFSWWGSCFKCLGKDVDNRLKRGLFTWPWKSPKSVVWLFQDDTQPDEITQFILDHQFPLVGAYDGAVGERYSKESPLCLAFYTVDWSFDHRTGEEGAWLRRSERLWVWILVYNPLSSQGGKITEVLQVKAKVSVQQECIRLFVCLLVFLD